MTVPETRVVDPVTGGIKNAKRTRGTSGTRAALQRHLTTWFVLHNRGTDDRPTTKGA